MIKGFNLFLKNFGFYSFFVANGVNIHKKSLFGSFFINGGRKAAKFELFEVYNRTN